MVGVLSVTIANWRHRRGLPPNYFPQYEPKTPEQRQFEYLLGVVHGDGYVKCHQRKGVVLIPVALQDESYKNVLKQIFEQAYGYVPQEYLHNNCFYLQVCSIKIAEQFAKYKNHGRWITPELECPREYLAGLWDTDGSVQFRAPNCRKGNHVRTTVRSIALEQKSNGNLELVMPILKSLNFSPSLRTYTYENEFGTFEKDVIRIPSSDFALFKSTIPLKHTRKIAALEKIVEYKRRWKNQYGEGLILTTAQITQINVLRRKGLTYTQIANQLGVDDSTVQNHFARNESVDWKKCEYIMNGRCRRRVFLALNTPKTAQQISRELGIRVDHAYRSLRELTVTGIITCLTTEREKIHELTEEGRTLFDVFKKWAEPPRPRRWLHDVP